MSNKKEKLSEKKENDSFDQTDVSEKSALTKYFQEFFNKLREKEEEIDDAIDLIEEDLVKTLVLEEDSKEVFQNLSRSNIAHSKNAYTQIKASSSTSSDPKTDPEASKKDTASSVETISEKDVDSEFAKYFKVKKYIRPIKLKEDTASFTETEEDADLEFNKFLASLIDYMSKKDIDSESTKYLDMIKQCSNFIKEKKIEKILDTEEPKEEGCSKNYPSLQDTRTKAISGLESNLELSEKKKQSIREKYLNHKIQINYRNLLKIYKELKEKQTFKEKSNAKVIPHISSTIQTKSSSSTSSDLKTDPEASKKDTASSIETISEKVVDSEFAKYFKDKKYKRPIKLKDRETEEPKEDDCSKDCPSSKDTKTKAFSSPWSNLEISKKEERIEEEEEYLMSKIQKDIEQLLEDFKEMRKRQEFKKE